LRPSLGALLLLGACLSEPEPTHPPAATVAPRWAALLVGDSIRLAAARAPLTWASANPAVADVDQRGVVRARAPGFASITATFDSGSAVAQIVVTPAPPVLVGAGDIAGCSWDDDSVTAHLLDSIPGVVFTAGDDAYPNGTAADFSGCYDPTWGRHKARTRPSLGNHDYRSGAGAAYFAYFGPVAGDAGLGYYSYDFAAWHIISLNSNVAMTPGSAEETWLRADLAAHPVRCTLAYWHHPLFSSGLHGNDPGIAPLWQALYDANADVVVNGHDHTYERFAPQSPTGVLDTVRGIREFVVGTGGASFYQFPTLRANSEIRNNTTHGVIKLTLHSDTFDWEFVPVAGGAFRDSGSGRCH